MKSNERKKKSVIIPRTIVMCHQIEYYEFKMLMFEVLI